VVERHPGTAIHPRAALFNQRTIELYRSLGLEPDIVEASGGEFVQNGAIVSVESLGGREIDWYFRNINEGVEELSPSPRLFITQIALEPILRARAEALARSDRHANASGDFIAAVAHQYLLFTQAVTDFDRALANFDGAIATEPSNAIGYLARSNFYARRGNADKQRQRAVVEGARTASGRKADAGRVLPTLGYRRPAGEGQLYHRPIPLPQRATQD
jgi:hypothetical protein